MAEMRESLKIVDQAIENLPAGPVNVDDRRAHGVADASGMVYSTIEGLISHFELVMSNRGFEVPYEEVVLRPSKRPTASWAFTSSATAADVAYRARCRPPSFIHFAVVPAPDSRPHAERHRGRVGQFEHHCRGVGSIDDTIASQRLQATWHRPSAF